MSGGLIKDRPPVAAEAKLRFTSNILPKWARRSKSLDALLPALFLRGISTGDFQQALSALPGTDAPNLSAGVIARLTAGWQEDYDRWQDRDLSARRYVCIWADGVYRQARMEPEAECTGENQPGTSGLHPDCIRPRPACVSNPGSSVPADPVRC